MKIRQIKPGEREQIALVYNNAFRPPLEMTREWAKSSDLSNTRAIFEGTRLVSMLQILPYSLWIGGNEISMGGIAGVATWADCQGKGYASMLMKDSLEVMRERAQWVSALYPFSHKYYGKFGWASAGHRIKYINVQQHHFTPFAERALVTADDHAWDITTLNTVYESMAKTYNLCLKRTKKMWKNKLDSLKKNNGQVYLIRDGKKAIGWFFCQNIRDHGGYFNESLTNEFAFTDQTAALAMMGFLSILPTNVKTITLLAPYSLNLWHYFKEPFIETRLQPEMQFRIVDIERAGKARGYKQGISGKICIALKDTYAPWNQGTWCIDVQDGKNTKCAKTGAKPDIECDIQAFSQLFCGYVTAERLIWEGKLSVNDHSKIQLLNELFNDQPTHMQDWF